MLSPLIVTFPQLCCCSHFGSYKSFSHLDKSILTISRRELKEIGSLRHRYVEERRLLQVKVEEIVQIAVSLMHKLRMRFQNPGASSDIRAYLAIITFSCFANLSYYGQEMPVCSFKTTVQQKGLHLSTAEAFENSTLYCCLIKANGHAQFLAIKKLIINCCALRSRSLHQYYFTSRDFSQMRFKARTSQSRSIYCAHKKGSQFCLYPRKISHQSVVLIIPQDPIQLQIVRGLIPMQVLSQYI